MSGVRFISGINPIGGQGMRIEMRDGKIDGLYSEPDPDEGYLSAGLIDLQINGYDGIDLNSGALQPEHVHELCKNLLRLGVTSFLPTLITASERDIIAALSAIAKARTRYERVAAMVPGIHIEGPSISPEDGPRGAHPFAHIRSPSIDEFSRWQAACDGLVNLVTLAPEHEGSLDYIRALSVQNVHVSLGHTGATPDRIALAIEAGATLSTHLGNGAAALLPRHPNFIWTQLASDRLTAMFIADGHHLPADTFKAMLRAKGLEKSILVSDMVALAGQKPGVYEQTIGGKVELSPEGRISLFGTPYLAGAGVPLATNIAIAMEMGDIALADALLLATRNPGRFVGGRGVLAVGKRADIVRFSLPQNGKIDPKVSLDIQNVWLAGEMEYGT